MNLEQFIPEGLGEYDTFSTRGGPQPITMGNMGDPMAQYRMAMQKEAMMNQENMRRMQMMQGMGNNMPRQARMGNQGNMQMMQQMMPQMMRGVPQAMQANTGVNEALAAQAHQKSLQQAQMRLMQAIQEQNQQSWFEEWSPLLLSLAGAAMGGWGLPGLFAGGGLAGAGLGASLGSGAGQAYQQSGY